MKPSLERTFTPGKANGMTNGDGFNPHDAQQVRLKLRRLLKPLTAFALVVAAGHIVSFGLAERYLRPACAAAAEVRHWQSDDYRLPGLTRTRGPRRSYCIMRDAQGSEHLLSANRVVVFAIVFDPWLVSVVVGVLAAVILVRRDRQSPS
ncbi:MULTISPECIES: hypothetical protein [unclassified Novosphingobium]|uniref:hypothetical protein n=1 Tax=unclassified Novosphingobium TaxID=2644732 RepID=UPI0010BD0F5B|nr:MULTISPECIES: hypothetical protein [unclassified Novosphingobium]QCI96346.1 hypothetical protein FA702_22080 [Novosphingobium sp. EMRT-2]